jgi:hypothetical protein
MSSLLSSTAAVIFQPLSPSARHARVFAAISMPPY